MKTIVLSIVLLLSLTVFSQTSEKNFIDQNYIEVIGKSEMKITPDEIYLKIQLNEKDLKVKSIDDAENLMINKLQEIGIDTKKDLAIKDFASNFKFYWLQKSDVVLSKQYQLLVREPKTVEQVFIELQKLGISNISIDKVDHSKIQDFKSEVKINAIKAAQEKARSLAIAINQNIGRAIYIQELDNNFSNGLTGAVSGIRIRGYSNTISSVNKAGETEIEFEKINLDYSILVRFELK
ncbi:MAG: SIMPL domain-containing protein [Bacteroidales bacterium]|nr:SIMPL domain-containing protein [Bacteroidales bacterium]